MNTRTGYLPSRNLYAGQQTAVRTRHGTMDWFQIGKCIHQSCVLSHCLFNFYASCEMLCWMKHRYNLSSVFFSFYLFYSPFIIGYFSCFFLIYLKFSLFSVLLFPNSVTFLNTNALYYLASLVAQLINNMPAMQKTEVRSLGQEDPLENGMVIYLVNCLFLLQ